MLPAPSYALLVVFLLHNHMLLRAAPLHHPTGPKDYLGEDGYYYYLFSTPIDYHAAELTCTVLGKELVPYQAGGAAKAAADKLCSPLNGNQPDAEGAWRAKCCGL